MFQEAAEKIADGIRPYLEANLQSVKEDKVASLYKGSVHALI